MPKTLGYGVQSMPSSSPSANTTAQAPMPLRSAADDRQVHHAKGRAVAEVVNPSNDVRGERVLGLLDGLSQHHGAEARKDFEQVHRRHDCFDAPLLGEHKWEAEHVVRHGREQSGGQSCPSPFQWSKPANANSASNAGRKMKGVKIRMGH